MRPKKITEPRNSINRFIPPLRDLAERGLYDPKFERDGCGVGLVANIGGERTHKIINQALEVLVHLGHRGARGADPETGDGVGILIQIPHNFLVKATRETSINLPDKGRYGVAIIFMPNDIELRRLCEQTFESVVRAEGLEILGWRDVPVNPERIGWLSRKVMPIVRQAFLKTPADIGEDEFERRLYVARKQIETEIDKLKSSQPIDAIRNFYICSMSARTIVYKGLIVADQLKAFYLDLQDNLVNSAFALVHSRFSTNTLGEWKLAHPYRMLCHNGEINTLQGNVNWMRARSQIFTSSLFGHDIRKLSPVTKDGESDTASFDQAFELLTLGGREIEHAAAMMIPEPWFGHESMPAGKKAFYEYHGSIIEPWDGPAMMAFTDGKKVGAVLDRNGLRPMRYLVTTDGLLVMASETGVLAIDPERVQFKSRLKPGMMFLVDFEQGRIIEDSELKNNLAERQPYGEWLKNNQIKIEDLPEPKKIPPDDTEELLTLQQAFGYSQEDIRILMDPMGRAGQEPVGSMGNDSPLALLSEHPQNLFSYFKQQFAQVSNPPLDAIREQLVTQVSMTLGAQGNLFDETPAHCRQLRLDHPIITNGDLAKIKAINKSNLSTKTISTLWKVAAGETGLRDAMDRVRAEASQAALDGHSILILSDRGVDNQHAAIPSLLAVGGIHHHMIRNGTRLKVSLVVESGEPREVHHFACLFGYGASAINPYLACETVENIIADSPYEKDLDLEPENAVSNFIYAATKGVLKTMSKMGISTLQSYHGAQIFEALGLSQKFVDEFFTWTPTRIEGIGLQEVADDSIANHALAFNTSGIPAELDLDIGGLYLWRATGEYHMFNPDTISLLQDAVRNNDRAKFDLFTNLANSYDERLATIRGLLDFKFDPKLEIPLDDVEPASRIVTRIATGAVSLGSISQETHETLAIAMNRIGARSNTGEGGEDSARYKPDQNGDSRSSAIKQVASGRFGVTINYLTNSTDIQIKMAQGSKPGEGGQISGTKITEYIGQIRYTTPGVELISPPPHHDIYSIEDLAQLIHDLKNANPQARIHVKLVSKAGVGTIAAGVSKGKGDVVLISGDSGGTGNSPLSSIKHAGLPWELGLAETQQILVANGLRGRIVVQTDGQLKTGRDVAIATLLGADEWGIATGSLISLGCIMLRKCHLNTCSVGIATQDPDLRKHFTGKPEHLINYFTMIAEQLRGYMAKLGFRTVDQMIGRSDRLETKKAIEHWKTKNLDLSSLLYRPDVGDDVPFHHCEDQDHELELALDHKLIETAEPAIKLQQPVQHSFDISNQNRTVGAMMSNHITLKYGEEGLPEDTIKYCFNGSAGQSFGAFLTKGVTFKIEGDANDYLGKGLSGGRIILVPPLTSTFKPEDNVITGNVNFYGATGGEAYVRGIAGERFCVRNSGVKAVVEGIGDHGCEYMTGGVALIIGPTGRNFAAGMSGGLAYIFDQDSTFAARCNQEMVDLEQVEEGTDDESTIREMLKNHFTETGSTIADQILTNWQNIRSSFVKVMPRDYKRVLAERALRGKTGKEELVRYG